MSSRKVEVILAFDRYSVGQILEPYGAHRELLIKRGYVKPYVEPTPAAECAAPAPEVFAPLDADVVPSAAGAPTAVIDRPQQTRKKHGR